MITFNPDEIFEMAEQIERNGARFYRKAAESAGDESRSLLEELAAMEDDHEKTFATMRAELSGAEKRPITADPDNESALYLRAMADGKVFADDPSQRLTGGESMADILTTAIGLEKDSIVFYESIKEFVTKNDAPKRIDGIIRQEIGHIVDLTGHLEALKK